MTEVVVCHRPTGTMADEAIAADLALLDEGERSRCARFAFARDRREFTAAHALLRRTLSRYRPVPPARWQFDATDHGRPVVAASQAGTPPLGFSLSHTHGLVACAVATGADVGIDVESIDRRVSDMDGFADRFFARSEVAGLRAIREEDRPARFIELWVLKEAYVKALGLGLSHPLDAFRFEFDGGGGLRLHADGDSRWQVALFSLLNGRCRMAVAVRAAARRSLVLDPSADREGPRLLASTATGHQAS